jgi:hypothetical protein
MARIRLLAPVAGHLAAGIPAPAVLEPVEVPDAVADSWCDGERAEFVPDVETSPDLEAVHAEAREYLAAVQAQHAAEIEAVHAQAREYLAAVQAQHDAEIEAAAAAQIAEPRPPAKPNPKVKP